MSGRLMTSTAMVLLLAGGALAQQQEQQQPAPERPATEQAQGAPQEELEQQTEQAQQQLEQQEQATEQAEEQPAETEEQPAQQAEEQPAEGGEQQMAAGSFDYIKMQEEGQVRAQEWIGRDARNAQDEDLGDVEDLLIDDQDQVVGVVLSVGGFLGLGAKNVAVPIEVVQVEEEAVRIEATREQLENAPDFATLDEVRAAEEAQRAQQQMPQATQPAAPPPTE